MSFLTDFRDRGAITLMPGKRALDTVSSLIAAVLGVIIPLYGSAEHLFATLPAAARVIHFVTPLCMLWLAHHVIVLKQPQANAAGFTEPGSHQQWVYTYAGGTRWAAKIALLSVIGVLAWEVFDKAPNFVLRRNVVRAFVHDASGLRLQNVTVVLYDSFGNRVSPEAITDDEGFVFLYPQPTGQRPVTWAAVGSCTSEHFPIGDVKLLESRTDTPRTTAFSWTLACPNK